MSSNFQPQLAVQLYSLRFFSEKFDQVVAAVADAGFDGVELVHDHGLPAQELKQIVDDHGLAIASAHIGFETLKADLRAVIDFHLAVGNTHLIVPAPPEALRITPDPEPWRTFANTLGKIGQQCAQEGLHLGYHNHHWEMKVLKGRRVIDWIMAETDENELFLEPDLAWIVHGGEDASRLLGQYGPRCQRIHMKDLAPEGENEDQMGLADVGAGRLDWDAIFPALAETNADWLVVEHDKPKDALSSIQHSLAFIRQKL